MMLKFHWTLHTATLVQKRWLVEEEVRRQEEGEQHAKAVSMARQGDGPTGRAWKRKSSDGMTSGRWREWLSFVIRATYKLLASPKI